MERNGGFDLGVRMGGKADSNKYHSAYYEIYKGVLENVWYTRGYTLSRNH